MIARNADNPTALGRVIYMKAAWIIGPDKNTTGMLLLISVCFVSKMINVDGKFMGRVCFCCLCQNCFHFHHPLLALSMTATSAWRLKVTEKKSIPLIVYFTHNIHKHCFMYVLLFYFLWDLVNSKSGSGKGHVYGGRESSMHCKRKKNYMQIENTPAKKQQHLNQFDNTCTANAHNTTKTEKLWAISDIYKGTAKWQTCFLLLFSSQIHAIYIYI